VVFLLEGRDYDDLGDFSDGMCWFYKDKRYGYIDKTGNEVIPPTINLQVDFQNGIAILNEKRCGDCKVDVMNKKGDILPFQLKVDNDWAFGYQVVYDRGINQVGLVDQNWNLVLPMKYDNIDICSDELIRVSISHFDGDFYNYESWYINLKTGMNYKKD